MSSNTTERHAFLTLTLHAHLPWVVNHGIWPHGIEWLYEAAVETYLPLLGVFGRLERDGIASGCNLNLSPVLLEQLAHPTFRTGFANWLKRKADSAREDESVFRYTNEPALASLAAFWQSFYTDSLVQFDAIGRDIAASFRRLADAGVLEILTCAATHGYLPLLGTDESLRAQVRTGVDAHRRHFGREPEGIWAPECGYRPRGLWSFPVAPKGEAAAETVAPTERPGVESVLGESGLRFFFVDTHLIERSAQPQSPYGSSIGGTHGGVQTTAPGASGASDELATRFYRRLYRPYRVEGSDVFVFPRDPRTGLQVWSGEQGYPADPEYLDFHKKRWPGGLRYWRVTDAHGGLEGKGLYSAQAAAERIRSHAAHFVHLVTGTLQGGLSAADAPPILCAPFDAELFGHWWFEGPQWLEAVVRAVDAHKGGLGMIGAGEFLRRFPQTETVHLEEGSWGAGGDNRVWLNDETAWTYGELYGAELAVRRLVGDTSWRRDGLGRRIAAQMCRELLLLEGSDWQFLITTGSARDYAEARFRGHLFYLNRLRDMAAALQLGAAIDEASQRLLEEMEWRDGLFAEIDPDDWVAKSGEGTAAGIDASSPEASIPEDAGAAAVLAAAGGQEEPKFE